MCLVFKKNTILIIEHMKGGHGREETQKLKFMDRNAQDGVMSYESGHAPSA